MEGSDVILVTGAVALVVGAFASRMPEPIRANRRWILLGGLALLLVSAVMAWPDLVQGFKDGRNGR